MSSLLYIDKSYSEYNVVINQLQDYILDDNNIQKSLRLKMQGETKYKKQYEKIVNEKIVNEKIFVPIQQDTLFWCYFIIVNGDTAYEILNNKNSLIAKQIKIDLVTTIRQKKEIVKTYKFDTITNIESNLANDASLNIKTFLTLCAIANINVIYINKKTYFESFMNDTSVVYVISENNQSKYVKKYGYQLANQELVNSIRTTFYKLDKVDKPIKAMSGYKVEDLICICERLEISIINKDTGKNKTKKDLYEAIVQYF